MANKSPKKDEPINTEKEISDLKNEIKRLDRLFVITEKYYDATKKEIDSKIKSFKEDFDINLGEAKKEITTFTFGLISSIIGFLSLMIAIVVLWINKDGTSNEMLPIYVAIAVAFIGLFIIFIVSWVIKNFPKIEGDSYRNIISYTNSKIKSNNSDMVDFVDSKISDVGNVINSKNSEMRKYIESKNTEMKSVIESNNSKMRDYIKGEKSE